MFAPEMCLPVHFDNQFTFITSHIREEGTDRVLAAELKPCEAAAPKLPPQDALSRGHLLPELASHIPQCWVTRHRGSSTPSPPTPLPRVQGRGEKVKTSVAPFSYRKRPCRRSTPASHRSGDR